MEEELKRFFEPWEIKLLDWMDEVKKKHNLTDEEFMKRLSRNTKKDED